MLPSNDHNGIGTTTQKMQSESCDVLSAMLFEIRSSRSLPSSLPRDLHTYSFGGGFESALQVNISPGLPVGIGGEIAIFLGATGNKQADTRNHARLFSVIQYNLAEAPRY